MHYSRYAWVFVMWCDMRNEWNLEFSLSLLGCILLVIYCISKIVRYFYVKSGVKAEQLLPNSVYVEFGKALIFLFLVYKTKLIGYEMNKYLWIYWTLFVISFVLDIGLDILLKAKNEPRLGQ